MTRRELLRALAASPLAAAVPAPKELMAVSDAVTGVSMRVPLQFHPHAFAFVMAPLNDFEVKCLAGWSRTPALGCRIEE